MFGGGSIQLARVFGIRIGVDASWFLILFLIIWSLSGYFEERFPEGSTSFVLAVLAALLFFASVLLHELGHALEARRSGIEIREISLWMFGGIAHMGRDSVSAGEEFRVAIAGPLVTLAIVVLCWIGGALIADPTASTDALRLDAGGNDELGALLGYLGFINMLLLLFNLIPAFPLDGGRIARAFIWAVTGSRRRATRIAGQLGRAFAYLMMAGGAYFVLVGIFITGVWLIVIGVFLGQGARSAIVQTDIAVPLEGLSVADVMDTEPVALTASLTLDRAHEDFFLRYRWPWFPVVDEGGYLIGLIAEDSVDRVPESRRPAMTVAEVMASDSESSESSVRVRQDAPLETLITREGLMRLGALLAVDADGRLSGIVTVDALRRALRPAAGQ